MADRALAIDVRAGCNDVTLVLTGELDLSSVDTLRSCLAAIDGGVRRVVLDVSGLTFLDSTGISLILQTQQGFEPEMRELVLHNPKESVARVLELTGVSQQLPITGSHTR